MEIPYAKEQFDYIILADVLEHLYDPERTLARLLPYLKTGGSFLCSIPNIMHTSVLLPLLQENFDYSDSGICDRTHIRFFTLNSIAKMFQKLDLTINNLTAGLGGLPTKEEDQLLNFLEEIPNLAPKAQFQVSQYIFSATK